MRIGRRTLRLFSMFAALGLVLLLVVVCFRFFASGALPTTFNVSAETERVRFVAPNEPPSRWVLEDVELVHGYANSRQRFSGYFQPASNVEVIVERVAFGPLYVHVSLVPTQMPAAAQDSALSTSVGSLFFFDERPAGEVGRALEVFATNLPARAARGSTIVLPLTGFVEIGRKLGLEAHGTTALLRSGRVRMLGRSLLRERVFEAGQSELEVGDQFSVVDAISPSLGFIVADERAGLTAAYRSVGTRGIVTRPGGGSYSLSASPLDQVLHDPLFRGISVWAAVLLAFSEFLGLALDRLGRRGEKESKYVHEDVTDEVPSGTDGPRIGVLLLACILFPLAASAQSSVHVKGAESGQGLLRARESSCYVLVPSHVITSAAGTIDIVAWGALRSPARLERTFASDVAVLRLEGGDVKCSPWTSVNQVPGLVTASGGYLRIIEESGAETRLAVDISRSTEEYLIVRPRTGADRIRQTMSGAALVINEVVVGQLMKVCTVAGDGCIAGDGDVLRIDAASRLTDGFFRVSETAGAGRTAPPVTPANLADVGGCPSGVQNVIAGPMTQRIGKLIIRLKSIDGLGTGNVRAVVEFTNAIDVEGGGNAVAFKPRTAGDYSDARADLTDDLGGRYKLAMDDGLPFATSADDWTTLGLCESRIVVLPFSSLIADPTNSRSRSVDSYTLSADLWIATRHADARVRTQSAVIYLSGRRQ